MGFSMPNAEMKIYLCVHGIQGKYGLVQNSAELSKQITVRNGSGLMSESDAECLGTKILQDESGCQINTNFKLPFVLRLSPTLPTKKMP